MNKRNKRGWRIPTEGTKARAIYDLMISRPKATRYKIADLLGLHVDYVKMNIKRIKEPEKTNEAEYALRKKRMMQGTPHPK